MLLIRFRRDTIVRMLRLTDAFIWEDLPTTDPVTGSLTMAAWIPRIQKFSSIITTTAISYHVIQTTIRFTTSDDRPFMYGTWYPFNATKSPAYELINISQVKAFVIRWVYSVLIYIVWLECKLGILIRLPHFGRYIWETSVVEFRNENFFRCEYVYMAATRIWLDIRTSFRS